MLLGKHWGKKVLAGLLCATMVLSMAACGGDTKDTETESASSQQESQSSEVADTGNKDTEKETQGSEDTEEFAIGNVKLDVTASEEAGNPLPFRVLTVDQIVAEMGTGWNLGNTMDGHSGHVPNETLWQDDKTTQELINAVHDLGFNTVRIPITWGKMINNDYSINDKWMSRVQDIVDYCMAQDMYVIINIHHDGADQSGWLNLATKDLPGLYEKFAGVWNTIATRFKDYDEHLIFESMNEVYSGFLKPDVEKLGFTYAEEYDNAVIMDLNQIFINTVRSTGSNNTQRYLSVPGRYTNIEIMTNEKYGFAMPADSVENRLFAAVHYYDWSFGMMESLATTEFKQTAIDTFVADIQKVVDKFTSKGIPVIMGEYGAVNKNNPAQRAYHNEIFNLVMQQAGVVPVYWDQGWYDRTQSPADYSFTLVDRKTYKSIEKEVTDALLRGFFASTGKTVADIIVSPTVTEISKVTLGEKNVTMTIGDVYKAQVTVAPENTNDVLLWKTDDYNVATVYNGQIYARGIGTATITAYSQSGSVKETIKVTVNPVTGDGKTSIAIAVVGGKYELEEGSYAFIDTRLTAADGIYVTYVSKNPEVVTVSKLGKLTAIAAGTTEVVVTSSDGVSKTIPVTVKEKEIKSGLRLALNVLFNDETLGCFNNEVGSVIEIKEDGQYTVTFDFAANASDATKGLGVTGLNNLTAIYIKDYDVTTGELTKSNLVSAYIKWDKIVVDGKELTITNSDMKSAIKASGIFDTNDPFNSWDGSAVEEVTSVNHVLNINMDNPQKVEVTFTISGLEFAE